MLQFRKVQKLTSYLLFNASSVDYLVGKLENKIEEENSRFCLTGHEVFSPKPTLRSSLEKDYTIKQVADLSDMSEAEATLAYTQGHSIPWDLLECATQIPMGKAPCSEALVIKVFDIAANKRDIECGHRLKDFKGKGGLNPDGSVDRSKLGYSLKGDADHKITAVVHMTGAERQPKGNISLDYGVKNGFSDVHAAFAQAGMPSINIYQSFKKDTSDGPAAINQFIKGADLDQYFKDIHFEATLISTILNSVQF